MADSGALKPRPLSVPFSVTVAQTMLLSDRSAPGPFDALYIPGLSVGMIKSGNLLQRIACASTLPPPGEVPIVFNGSDGERFGYNIDGDQDRPQPAPNSAGQGWPGKDYYIDQLVDLGIFRGNLIPTGPGYHTRHEMAQLVALARKYSWKRIGVVTVAWHYSSVFTMMVNAMKDADYFIAVYAIPSPHTEWCDRIVGSQGLDESMPVIEAIECFRKLENYQTIGRACSFDDLLRYLLFREMIAERNCW